MIEGIDVSNHQGAIDWDAVQAGGIGFAWIKRSEGLTFADAYFTRNWEECGRLGIPRGAYHYARPDYGTDPDAEADAFLSRLPPLVPGDMLALDIEAGAGDLRAWVLRWLTAVRDAAGFRPVMYSGEWFMRPAGLMGTGGDLAPLGEYGLWLAAYGTHAPASPGPWPVWAFWQYTSFGRIRGIDGNVDQDRFNGTPDRLARYGKPADPPPDPGPTIDQVDKGLMHKILHGEYLAARDDLNKIVGG